MNHWSDEIEEICEKLRINCVNLSEYHRKRFYKFKSYGKWFRLPLIILASVNSTASVGLQPVLPQQIISGITCLLGMIMGIIGSLELYLGIQAAMELELKQSKEYYTLAIHLFKTLSLHRCNRLEDGKEYLNDKYSLYIKLCESSNLLDKRMKSDLLANIPSNYESTNSQEDDNEFPKLYDLSPNNMHHSELIAPYSDFHKNTKPNISVDIIKMDGNNKSTDKNDEVILEISKNLENKTNEKTLVELEENKTNKKNEKTLVELEENITIEKKIDDNTKK